MPRKRNSDLSYAERRIQALRNELEGSRKYCKGLRKMLEDMPNDKWAQSQLRAYSERVERLERELAELDAKERNATTAGHASACPAFLCVGDTIMAFRGLLNVFSRATRIAQPFISRLASLGEPIARIRRAIGARIAGVRADELERIVVAERTARRRTEELIGGDLSRRISETELPEAITSQLRRFSWRIRYGFTDNVLGEVTDRYLTVSTDTELSPAEALEEARSIIASEYMSEGGSIHSLEIVRVTRAGNSPFV